MTTPTKISLDVNNKIVIIPINGFGNRLRSMASAWILSNRLKRTFYIDWGPCKWYAPEFQEIFESNNCEYTLVNSNSTINSLSEDQYKYIAGGYEGEQKYIDQISKLSNSEWIFIKAGGIFKDPEMSWKEYNNMKSYFYKNVLKIKAIHLKQATDFMFGNNFHNQTVLGVHIRKKDRKRISARTSAYVYEVKKLVKRYDKVFVCTDDENEIDHLSKGIGSSGKIIYRESTRMKGRENLQQYLDAIYDWYILSNCDLILYSKGSSFSYEACFPNKLSGSTEIVNFAKKIKSNKLPQLIF